MMKLRIKLRKLDYFRIILILLGIVLIIGSVDKITSFLNISIGWYDQNWKYRTAIITDYTKNSTNLTNHQVKIILNSHNFNYAHASVDGADIQFTENDGITPLDYWIEKWDNGGPSILWVKVPYIHASSKEIIYMYYGNPTARSVSSGENTFLFFDDFSSDKTTSPKDYFTDIGSSSSFISINQPAAQYYNGKTYIVFSGIGFDPYIAYHDHISGRWSDIVQVGDSPLMTDNHGPPALLIDNNGYLHVFYGAHTGALKHSKSTYPETISSWIVMPDVTSAATYPQVIQMSDGTIYLFYRAGEHADDWVYRTSLNNGLSWSKETAIIDGIKPRDAFYAMFIKGSNNTIHAAFIWKDDNNSLGAPRVEYYHRYNIYYIFKDTDGRWKNILGTNLTLPLTKTNADIYAKVYDSGRNHTQIPVIKVDSNNNPYILFLTGGYYGSTSYTYKFAKRTGDFWEIVDLGAITDNLFDFYNLDVISPTAIDAYLIRGGTKGVGDMNDRGGNLEKWSSSDGGDTWNKEADIITNLQTKEIYNDPQIVLNYHPDAKIVFSEWTNALSDFTKKVYLFGDSGFIQNNNLYNTHSAGKLVNWKRKTGYLEATISEKGVSSIYFPDFITLNENIKVETEVEMSSEIGMGMVFSLRPSAKAYSATIFGHPYNTASISLINHGVNYGSALMDRILTSTSFIPTPNKRYEISIQKLKNDNLVFIWNGNSLAIPFDDYQEGKFSLLAQAGIQSNNSGVIRFYYLRARNYAQTEPLVNIGKEEKRNLFLK